MKGKIKMVIEVLMTAVLLFLMGYQSLCVHPAIVPCLVGFQRILAIPTSRKISTCFVMPL